MYPYPGREREIRAVLYVRVQILQAMKEFQRRPHCAFGVVFVGDRIAKVDDNSVSLKLGNKPAEALHDRQGQVLIAALQQSKVFGIKLLGQRRVADQIDKKAREIASFGEQTTLATMVSFAIQWVSQPSSFRAAFPVDNAAQAAFWP